ncbi:uncharacterized protein LOC121258824 [Juglans microcarpa x Juglans regia]|uniref:uncharacterized protein LOC121258824 n=1 Tax=Juglans microcarpa x Juglans regia TaxID=2249226 RepID=UPI001B7F3F16|nr:uncharacterized protein LOC121258824 [Juglans microcarpa x Juglans regia]
MVIEGDYKHSCVSLSIRPPKTSRTLPAEQPDLPPSTPSFSPMVHSVSMQAPLSQSTPAQLPLRRSPTPPSYVPSFMLEAPSSSSVTFQQEGVPFHPPNHARRNRKLRVLGEGKSETIPAPFPWATTHRATVHSLNHLLSNQIYTISGDVQCKRCHHKYEMEYNLMEKFVEVGSLIAAKKSAMHDRAPSFWTNPVLPTCKSCGKENSAKPIIIKKKKAINWLFLLLGQMLGCCTLDQLKYFCKHTKNHRTGAKNRVLYLTYLGLCKQLDPDGPFDP